jgi:hypothetical protein
MNKRGAKRCEFCNSASHTMYKCNSNMNGLRESLDNNGCNCMMDSVCPKFEMLQANQLRYIAYHYAQYENAIHCAGQVTTQHYNQKFKLRPIPLTLSKKQMVHALVQRWTGFQTVRGLYNNPSTQVDDGDDCPICLDPVVSSYKWSYETSSWKGKCVTTACKHRFCTTCWNSHIERNSRHSGWWRADGNGDRVVQRVHICCPMCRHEIEVV